MVNGSGGNFESMRTDQLKLELLEELHMKDLEQLSILDNGTGSKLNIDNEGSEWKNFYEIQLQVNDQQKQIVTPKDKSEKISYKPFREATFYLCVWANASGILNYIT